MKCVSFLHTTLWWVSSNSQQPNVVGFTIPKSYCSISECLAHGPSAIWCHLRPILEDLPGEVDTLHFLSDGPATQYKNKYMFYILGTHLKTLFPNICNFTWNYFEAGHGKRAADGIGAVCKRTADRYVAQGNDLLNFHSLYSILREKCPNVI